MRKERRVVKIDCFDLENIEDLPAECAKEVEEVKKDRFSPKTKQLLNLFTIKPLLNTRELVVGMYRVHKATVTKQWVSTTMSNLVKRGLLQSPSKGIFKTVLDLPKEYRD